MATTSGSLPPSSDYPATLSIDYPDRKLNRLTSFFRIFTVIPILIILILLSSPMVNNDSGIENQGGNWEFWVYGTATYIFLPLVLMILFRKKYPKWWFDWNLQFARFSYRIWSYFMLMRDEYPSTDEEQAVHLDLKYPDAERELGRGWPLIKWLLAIPHYIVLFFLGIAVFVVWIIAWFAILFTGRYPQGLFNFVEGYMRWFLRVTSYAFTLITDKYPPFSLS